MKARENGEIHMREVIRQQAEIRGEWIDREFASKKHIESEDTKIRKAIHKDIMKMIKDGKKKEEILEQLLDKYKGTNPCNYIPQWCDYHYEKIKKEDEGR